MKQGCQVNIPGVGVGRFLYFQRGKGYHVLVHGRELLVSRIGKCSVVLYKPFHVWEVGTRLYGNEGQMDYLVDNGYAQR